MQPAHAGSSRKAGRQLTAALRSSSEVLGVPCTLTVSACRQGRQQGRGGEAFH